MHCDLGYIDLEEEKTLEPLENPFGAHREL
jgi:hypothetical protein